MPGYTIEIVGLEKFLAGLDRVESGLTHLRPLMELFGKEFYSEEVSLFDTAPWAPLKPETEAQKAKRFGGPSRILVATGTLLDSLTRQGATGNIHRVEDDGAEFGSNIFYGIFHHEGRGHLPERRLLPEADERRYETVAAEYAAEMLKEAGFN